MRHQEGARLRALGASICFLLVVSVVVVAPPAADAVTPYTSTPLGITGYSGSTVDPATGRIVVAGGDNVVVVEPDGTIAATIPLVGAGGVDVEGTDLWVTRPGEGKVSRIDLVGLTVDETYTVGMTVGASIVVVGAYVWFVGDLSANRWDLLRLDPGTGLIQNMGGSVYGGRLAEIPGSTTRLLFYDSLNSFSVYRTDITGDSLVFEDDVASGVGSNLREVVATEDGTFITASGAPYRFPEYALSTMDATSVIYVGTNYPAGVDYVPFGGGVIAGITQSTNNLYVYRTGVPAPVSTISVGAAMSYRSVELAPDASAAYVVVITGSTFELRSYPLGPVVESIVPAVVEEGVATTVTVSGSGLPDTIGVKIGGVSVTFDPGGNLDVDVPGTLAAGVHVLEIETTFGSTTADLVVANLPGPPTAPVGLPAASSVFVSWDAPGDGGTPITGYEVKTTPGEGTCSTNSEIECQVTGLANGTSYTFAVRAVNAIGAGDWSPWSGGVVPVAVPGSPSAPIATGGPGTATVSWSDVIDDGGTTITSYEVRTTPGTATCDSTTASGCTVEGLTNGLPYQFSVRAVNAVGAGPWSLWSAEYRPTACGAGGGPFPDVGGGHTFCTEIEWLAAHEIANGFTDGTFGPTRRTTRGAFAAMAFRYADDPTFSAPPFPTFTDVGLSFPFYQEIEWLVAAGLANGYADGTFGPAREVTRQSVAAILYRMAGSPPYVPAGQTFSDVSPAHPFYVEIEWFASTGITTGFTDGTYRGALPVTRQALAAFLARFDQQPW